MSGSRKTGAWLGATMLLAFALTWWVMHRPVDGSEGSHDLPACPEPMQPVAQVQPVAESMRVAAAPAPVAGETVVCREQSIEVSKEDDVRRHCMGRTQAVQNGNVRTFRVFEQGGAGQSLRVDAAGETIVAVEWSGDAAGSYSCQWSECTGIFVGPYDAQGARSIVLKAAKLTRTQVVDDVQIEETIALSGRLRTIPDDQMAATTCVGQVLYISIDAGTIHFCPDGGTGFDVEDDGDTTYRFTNADGNSLGVRVAPDGSLRGVEFGNYTCRAPACSGVTIAPVDRQGRRDFRFHGTTLIGQDGATSVLLNGNVVLEAQ